MSRPLAVGGTFVAVLVGIIALAVFLGPPHDPNASLGHGALGNAGAADQPTPPPPPITAPPAPLGGPAPAVLNLAGMLILPNCGLSPTSKQEVPSQRDGQLLYVGTDLSKDDLKDLPADAEDEDKVSDAELSRRGFVRVIEPWVYFVEDAEHPVRDGVEVKVIDAGGKASVRKVRRARLEERPDAPALKVLWVKRILKRVEVGTEVERGQLLAMIDPLISIEEFQSKQSSVEAAKADFKASEKTRDEALQRWKILQNLQARNPGAVTDEELRGAKLTYERYVQEAIAKGAAIVKAERELGQALAVLFEHEVRAKVPGTVHLINRHRGDAVKNLETLMQLQDHERLRCEGRMEMQHLALLPKHLQDAKVVLEPIHPEAPSQQLMGHSGPVRAVAVSQKRQIVSASDDKTVRVWDRKDGTERATFWHPRAVLAVACTPKGYTDADNRPRNLCLTGCADGAARLWDLDHPDSPPVVFQEKHAGPINAVAFSPKDGLWCATGGEDKTVCLWDTRTGRLLERYTGLHAGGVTSVQFLSPQELVTAGRGNSTLCLVTLDRSGHQAGPAKTFPQRSGNVAVLGVHAGDKPGSKLALFDIGRELRILDLPSGALEASVQNTAEALTFGNFAIFSPDQGDDGKPTMLLTGSAGDGRVQLWRTPSGKSRAYELRQLVWPGAPANCGAFSPMGDDPADEFAVTGTQDQQVLVWSLPAKNEVREQLTARLKVVGPGMDGPSRELPVSAELDNPKDADGQRRLRPGQTATMVVYPSK